MSSQNALALFFGLKCDLIEAPVFWLHSIQSPDGCPSIGHMFPGGWWVQVPPFTPASGCPWTFSEGRWWGGVEGTLGCGPVQLPHLLETKTLSLWVLVPSLPSAAENSPSLPHVYCEAEIQFRRDQGSGLICHPLKGRAKWHQNGEQNRLAALRLHLRCSASGCGTSQGKPSTGHTPLLLPPTSELLGLATGLKLLFIPEQIPCMT